MEHLLFLLIGLFLGVSLGMVTMGLLAASEPEPHPGPPRAGRSSWLEVHDPSLEGIADPTHGTSGSRVTHPA